MSRCRWWSSAPSVRRWAPQASPKQASRRTAHTCRPPMARSGRCIQGRSPARPPRRGPTTRCIRRRRRHRCWCAWSRPARRTWTVTTTFCRATPQPLRRRRPSYFDEPVLSAPSDDLVSPLVSEGDAVVTVLVAADFFFFGGCSPLKALETAWENALLAAVAAAETALAARVPGLATGVVSVPVLLPTLLAAVVFSGALVVDATANGAGTALSRPITVLATTSVTFAASRGTNSTAPNANCVPIR